MKKNVKNLAENSDKKLKLSAAVLAVIITTLLATNPGLASQKGNCLETGQPDLNQQNHQAVLQAVENNDYQAWLKLMGQDKKITKIISQENFIKLKEIHDLMQSGDYEKAHQLREELGFPPRKSGQGKRLKIMRKRKKMEAAQAALGANDYQAWLSAVGQDSPIAEKINQENWSKFVEGHGYMEKAKQIFAELGIKESPGAKK